MAPFCSSKSPTTRQEVMVCLILSQVLMLLQRQQHTLFPQDKTRQIQSVLKPKFYLHANNGIDEEEHCNEKTHVRQGLWERRRKY